MIVISDMTMPSCCRACQFAVPEFHSGIVTLRCGTRTGVQMYAPSLIYRNDRPDWCPLKELPDEKKT